MNLNCELCVCWPHEPWIELTCTHTYTYTQTGCSYTHIHSWTYLHPCIRIHIDLITILLIYIYIYTNIQAFIFRDCRNEPRLSLKEVRQTTVDKINKLEERYSAHIHTHAWCMCNTHIAIVRRRLTMEQGTHIEEKKKVRVQLIYCDALL